MEAQRFTANGTTDGSEFILAKYKETEQVIDRETWVDIAKGLGIIAVVLGHSGAGIASYLYWFHMPLFFILSGFLFTPISDASGMKSWIHKRSRRLLIPYFSFLAVVTLVEFLYVSYTQSADFTWLIKRIPYLIAGGRFLGGLFGGFFAPFWFVTCLYVTQVLFALIFQNFKSWKSQFTVIGLAYLLAHLEANLVRTQKIGC